MAKKFYSINAKQSQVNGQVSAAAEILIYAPIGSSWYEETVGAQDFINELNALDVNEITVRINSIGGSVPDGLAIYNAIKRHPAHVTTINDGLAASISGLILMAGDTVKSAENALLMNHLPWTYAQGNAVDLREMADLLDSWGKAIATSYAAKTGRTMDEELALISDGKDHLYGASEALEHGYIDEITEGLAVAASMDRGQLKAQMQDFYSSNQAVKPAAAAALNKGNEMPVENTPNAAATTPAAPTTPAQAAEATPVAVDAQAILAADQTRRNNIAESFARFSDRAGIAELQARCQNDTDMTVQAANDLLLAEIGKTATPVAGNRIITLEDETDKFRAGTLQALMARAGLVTAEANNEYRGFTMLEMARASLQRSGVNTNGMDKMSLIAAAFTHTSSDFTSLLSNIANKAMMKGFGEADETFQLFTSEGNLPDFKETKRVDLDAFPSLDKVRDGGEYKTATIGDRGESVMLATYGKKFSITRQAIINDDLDAFSKIPQRMGRAAIRTVGDLVFAILTANPKMSDNTALFHSNHKNLILPAGVLSTDSVDAMRVAMGTQKRGDAVLNTRLKNLIVPLALQGRANVVRDSESHVGETKTDNTIPNSVRNTFDVIADARLDADSSTAWYGAADQAVNDTIEVSYLDGVNTPTIEQQNGWDVDGVEMKVRLDAGVKALAFAGLAKNSGA